MLFYEIVWCDPASHPKIMQFLFYRQMKPIATRQRLIGSVLARKMKTDSSMRYYRSLSWSVISYPMTAHRCSTVAVNVRHPSSDFTDHWWRTKSPSLVHQDLVFVRTAWLLQLFYFTMADGSCAVIINIKHPV